MSRELFLSDCRNCRPCVGVLADGCPRYAYWGEPQSSADSPHYTGVTTEEELRARAEEYPGGRADTAVRAADHFHGLDGGN